MRVVAVTATFGRDQLPGDHHIADYPGVRLQPLAKQCDW